MSTKLHCHNGKYYLRVETSEHEAARRKLKRLDRLLAHAPESEQPRLREKMSALVRERNESVYYREVDPAEYPDARVVAMGRPPRRSPEGVGGSGGKR